MGLKWKDVPDDAIGDGTRKFMKEPGGFAGEAEPRLLVLAREARVVLEDETGHVVLALVEQQGGAFIPRWSAWRVEYGERVPAPSFATLTETDWYNAHSFAGVVKATTKEEALARIDRSVAAYIAEMNGMHRAKKWVCAASSAQAAGVARLVDSEAIEFETRLLRIRTLQPQAEEDATSFVFSGPCGDMVLRRVGGWRTGDYTNRWVLTVPIGQGFENTYASSMEAMEAANALAFEQFCKRLALASGGLVFGAKELQGASLPAYGLDAVKCLRAHAIEISTRERFGPVVAVVSVPGLWFVIERRVLVVPIKGDLSESFRVYSYGRDGYFAMLDAPDFAALSEAILAERDETYAALMGDWGPLVRDVFVAKHKAGGEGAADWSIADAVREVASVAAFGMFDRTNLGRELSCRVNHRRSPLDAAEPKDE